MAGLYNRHGIVLILAAWLVCITGMVTVLILAAWLVCIIGMVIVLILAA
jgi:hypothetical protein